MIYLLEGGEIASPYLTGNWDTVRENPKAVAGVGRRGGGACELESGYGKATYAVRKTLPVLSTGCWGFALKSLCPDGAAWIPEFYFLNGSADLTDYECLVRFNWNIIEIFDSTGTRVHILTHTTNIMYHYYEILIDSAAQEFKLFINEELVVYLKNFNCSAFSEITYTGSNGNTSYKIAAYYDDMYFSDVREGDLALIGTRPISDLSNVGFTPSIGTEVYPLVDELPEDFTDYAETADLGDKVNLGVITNLHDIVGNVLSIDVFTIASVSEGGLGIGLVPGITMSSVEYQNPSMSPTIITPSVLKSSWLVSPVTGLPFTLDEVLSISAFSLEVSP